MKIFCYLVTPNTRSTGRQVMLPGAVKTIGILSYLMTLWMMSDLWLRALSITITWLLRHKGLLASKAFARSNNQLENVISLLFPVVNSLSRRSVFPKSSRDWLKGHRQKYKQTFTFAATLRASQYSYKWIHALRGLDSWERSNTFGVFRITVRRTRQSSPQTYEHGWFCGYRQ